MINSICYTQYMMPKFFIACHCFLQMIPIDGDTLVNGEQQKRSEEVLPEVVTSFKLSNLRNVCMNSIICVN